MIDAKIFKNAAILWDYMCLNEQPCSADLLLVLGSIDERVAIRAAELSVRYEYPLVMFTGGIAHKDDLLFAKHWQVSEAEHFHAVFQAHGGKALLTLLETKAQHTGDNATLSYEEIVSNGESLPRTIQLVTKPYMERRAKATFEKQWPDAQVRIFVTSPQRTFEDYPNEDQPFEVCINIMVGDLQRIIEYPKRGLQSEQIIPDSVHEALDILIAAGFTKHLIK